MGKYAYIFQVGRGGRNLLMEEIFDWENISMGRKVSKGVNFLWGNFKLQENLPRIPIRNSSYVLLSLCRLNFMLGDVKGNCWGVNIHQD